MRFLNLFLFVGSIYANKDEAYTNQELTKLVNVLSNKLDRLTNQNMIGKIDYLQDKIDELKTNLTTRILAIENVDDFQNEIGKLPIAGQKTPWKMRLLGHFSKSLLVKSSPKPQEDSGSIGYFPYDF